MFKSVYQVLCILVMQHIMVLEMPNQVTVGYCINLPAYPDAYCVIPISSSALTSRTVEESLMTKDIAVHAEVILTSLTLIS